MSKLLSGLIDASDIDASDQDKGNSKTGRLTPLSTKESHLIRDRGE
jgi:hypothetical protein